MIGLTSRMTSPSSVVNRRSTPWVAGWCGPMLIVRSSVSSCVATAPSWEEKSMVASSAR
ncbi:unannotated protein [freshwater metagenome]|uniref:Unannotated protein n=1 Tax=freshwater metagenome TaxID=449393 RepID=A0A6J7IL96_9ZZZZ